MGMGIGFKSGDRETDLWPGRVGLLMTSFKALSWIALVGVSLLVACGGVSKTDGASGDSGNSGTLDPKGGNGQGGGKPGTGTGGIAVAAGGKDASAGAIALGGAPP